MARKYGNRDELGPGSAGQSGDIEELSVGNANKRCCLTNGQTRAIGAGMGVAIGLVGGSLVGFFSGRNRDQTLIYKVER